MAATPYLPTTQTGKLAWLQNFDLKLGDYDTKLTILPATITSVHADTLALGHGLALGDAAQPFDFRCTTYKVTLMNGVSTGAVLDVPVFTAPLAPPAAVQPGIFRRIGALVKTIKAHPNYTSDIGDDLEINGAEPSSDSAMAAEVKTILKPRKVGLYINIKYLKKTLSAAKLDCKRGSETEFSYLDTAIEANYVDRRPNLVPGQPETRQYRGWCVIKGEIVGVVSDVVSITVN